MYFVCRWREVSPFSKRVVALSDATVLDWFQRSWSQDDPQCWIEQQLGGGVYGLSSVFQSAGERDLSPPQTVDELRELLHEHLWVEGDDRGDFIRLGESCLRVRTDDDEVDLAYYFIGDDAVSAAPDRLAFMLHDSWPLPGNTAAAGAHFYYDGPVRTVASGSLEAERVFSVRLCWQQPGTATNLDLPGPVAFVGMTLPDLAAHLLGVNDADAEGWPHDARMLRALVAPGEKEIGPALRRYARLTGYDPSLTDIELAPEPDPRQLLLTLPMPATSPEPPTKSLIRIDTHIVQVARYIDDFFGFDQWFLFDSRWASTYPDLAHSLLRYATHWDPYQA
jgi:hypothetical protein